MYQYVCIPYFKIILVRFFLQHYLPQIRKGLVHKFIPDQGLQKPPLEEDSITPATISEKKFHSLFLKSYKLIS